MNERQIVTQLVTEIEAVVASDVDVRTRGGDQTVDPPEVVISWDPIRLSQENGHNSFGAAITDGSGNNTGIEHHAYFRMDATLTIRTTDEQQRDTMLDDIQMAFLPYETDSESFDRDTTEWEIDTAGPRTNSLIEIDWYESGVLLSFKYVKRTQDTGKDTIEDVPTSVDADDTIIDITSELK